MSEFKILWAFGNFTIFHFCPTMDRAVQQIHFYGEEFWSFYEAISLKEG